jgi:hypothetical protein
MRPANDFQSGPAGNTVLSFFSVTSGTWTSAYISVRLYLKLCDAHAPLFWESELSATFAHTPLPSHSTATLSPISSLQVIFIFDAPWLDSQEPSPGNVPLPWYI